jgi:HlyD family secretion protein
VDAATEIRETIGLAPAGGKKKSTKASWPVFAGLGVLAVVVVGFLVLSNQGSGTPKFTTAKIEKGDLTVTVSAVGELAPLDKVDVGIEVSGTLDKVLVENNDRVKAGQVLAHINTDTLTAQVQHAQAAQSSAQAAVGQASATLADANRTLAHARELRGRGFETQDNLDAAISAQERATAALASARAQVQAATADLSTAQTSLSKATVYSPVDGIVLDRKVDPGNTVVAAFQTPVLFTLAQDLTEMELKVAVDEADVGKVQVGQQATFTVDAYPNRTFAAEITRVRYNSTTKEGVVSYETLLKVANKDLALRPGMTAHAVIIVATVKDTLLAPNEALRFKPEDWGLGPLTGFTKPVDDKDKAKTKAKTTEGEEGSGELWVLKNGKPTYVVVQKGATDRRMTVVAGKEIAAGDTLILRTEDKDDRNKGR